MAFRVAVFSTVDFYLEHLRLPVQNYNVSSLRRNVYARLKKLDLYREFCGTPRKEREMDALMLWFAMPTCGGLSALLPELIWKEIAGPLYHYGHIALEPPADDAPDPFSQYLLELAVQHGLLNVPTPEEWQRVHEMVAK